MRALRMLKVGLTGGLACGKTFISEELTRLGCHVIHADALGHEVLAPGGEAYAAVAELFGDAILEGAPDKPGMSRAIVRARLAEMVFNDPDRLAALNAIVHPAVYLREEALMEQIERTEPDAILILEAAILIEAGVYQRFDRLIVAYCTEERQLERALQRDPAAIEADVRARLRRQMPITEKLQFADYVIDTDGTREETLRQTREIYCSLRQLRK